MTSLRQNLLLFASSVDAKRLAGNVGYLILGQVATYVLALALIPYLLNTVGIAAFGIITLAQTVVSYLMLLVEYGFNFSATQEVVRLLQEKDRAGLQLLFNRVLTTRLLLLFFSGALLYILVWFVPLYRAEATLFFLTYLQLVGHALYPLWLFQGAENMRLISILNLASRILFFVLVFIAVHAPADYLWVPALYSLGYLSAGASGLAIAMRQYRLQLNLATSRDVLSTLRSNLVLFLGNLSTYVYIYAPTVLGGFLLTRQDLGYYSIAERIMTAIRHVVSAIAQAVFPVSSRLSTTSHAVMRSFLKRAATIYTLAVIAGCILLYFLAPLLVGLLRAESMPIVVQLLQVLSWMPALFVVSFTFSHVLLVYGHKASYFVALISVSFVSILFTFLFARYWGVLGIAYAVIVSETFLMLMCIGLLEIRHKTQRLLGGILSNPTDV